MLVGKTWFSPILIISGLLIIAISFFGIVNSEKVLLVEYAIGILTLILGVYLLGPSSRPDVVPSRSAPGRTLAYLPFLFASGIVIFANLTPLWTVAVLIALLITLSFGMFSHYTLTARHIASSLLVLSATVGYLAFRFYPLDSGVDSWGYLSGSAIIHATGHFSAPQPIDPYYWPIPIMSVIPSVVSMITSLNPVISLLIFPGCMILIQPVLVFLVARHLFRDDRISALSALPVVLEPPVMQWVGAPIAESVALSLFLLVLVTFTAPIGAVRNPIVIFLLFFTIVALHLAIALIGYFVLLVLVEKYFPYGKKFLIPLAVVLVGYLISTSLITIIGDKVDGDLRFFLGLVTLHATALYSTTGLSRITLLCWGFTPSLALVLLVLRRPRRLVAAMGLALLGFSFIANVVAPRLVADRYVGLMAWALLASVAGPVLSILTRRRLQLAIMLLLVLVVSVSAAVSPSVSPQIGLGGSNALPTTAVDRLALSSLDELTANSSLVLRTDTFSSAYLTFLHYSTMDGVGFRLAPISDAANVAGSPIVANEILFLRSADFNQAMVGSDLPAIPQAYLQTHDVVYNSNFAALVSR